jgi:hypothetical protein
VAFVEARAAHIAAAIAVPIAAVAIAAVAAAAAVATMARPNLGADFNLESTEFVSPAAAITSRCGLMNKCQEGQR